MRRTRVRGLLLAALSVIFTISLAACGTDDDERAGSGATATVATTDDGSSGKRGGTLRVVSEEDAGSIDPGQAYGSFDFTYTSATQRPLYRYAPDDPSNLVPDLAAGEPEVSADGRTLTVRIKRGVRFSPPVDREVTSRDVKYAIERGFNPNVGSYYAANYYGDVVGADRADGGPIEGIKTPDDETIVFELTRPTARLLAQATVLPLSAPVPEEYARPLDSRSPSAYGNRQVATGPYMLEADASGRVLGTGYRPGRGLTLVRNPNWDPETDDRPAYLDRIEWSVGNDPNVAGRQVLEGSHMAIGDTPTAATIKRAVQQHPDQIFFSPGAGSRYVTLNTAIPPFDDENLRKAFAAALDREQMRQVRGGESIGDIASHFLYPGVNGFEEAGGEEGTGVDFLASPTGDPAVVEKYMRAAGYPDGRYTGDETVLVVGMTGDPSDKNAQIVDQTLRDLGFRTNFRLVDPSVVYSRFCALPRARVHVCANVGWIGDFSDPQTILDAPFNGEFIAPENNPNLSQLDDPEINRAIADAELIHDPEERARAWGEIDREITATAAAVPWLWDKQPVVFSADVRCVPQLWNQGHCDLAATSLE
jgi:peptide/nickel transport system substrate-binding protein